MYYFVSFVNLTHGPAAVHFSFLQVLQQDQQHLCGRLGFVCDWLWGMITWSAVTCSCGWVTVIPDPANVWLLSVWLCSSLAYSRLSPCMYLPEFPVLGLACNTVK